MTTTDEGERLEVGVHVYVRNAEGSEEGITARALTEVERTDNDEVQLRAEDLQGRSISVMMTRAAVAELTDQLTAAAGAKWSS
jgi:hypothetical protein